jgi:IS5 family transposase
LIAESLEEALKVRLDFMVITGLEKVPDHTTLCRFRNLLISQNIWEYLLAMVNYQIEQKGAVAVKYPRKGQLQKMKEVG